LCNHIAATDDDPETVESKPRAFWQTILAIQLMDLSLSVDNVVAAVAMSPDIRVVCIGVFLGLLTLLMFASVSLKLVEKFPILEHTAFFLIGYVGLILLTELSVDYFFHAHLHITPVQKFIGIVIIMLISLWYARSPALQKFCQPFFKVAMIPIRFYAMLVGGLIGVLLWPFRRLVAAFAAKA
jgi:predicted tellurium resistance membrane protein TerC